MELDVIQDMTIDLWSLIWWFKDDKWLMNEDLPDDKVANEWIFTRWWMVNECTNL